MSVGTQPAWVPALPPPLPMRRFTVDEYHRMIDAGVFGGDERFELLEGWIVAKLTRKPPHDATIELLTDVLRDRLPAGWRVRVQSAITTADSEPEPDLAVVRGGPRDYLKRHPGPADLAMVVEVADSSLADDRSLEARLYARAGIPAYWIVNLVDLRVEVYTDPTGLVASPSYRSERAYGVGDAVPLIVEGREVARIDALEFLP
jgi:Uma2 family endonuclease